MNGFPACANWRGGCGFIVQASAEQARQLGYTVAELKAELEQLELAAPLRKLIVVDRS